MIKDFGQAIKNIRRELKTYVTQENIRSLVLGVSGGIDSTLCAALACQELSGLEIPLYCYGLPTSTNKEAEIQRANIAGKLFGTFYEEVDITQAFQDIQCGLEIAPALVLDSKKWKIRQGNLKARLRMIKLFDCAAMNSGMVLSTDNNSELCLGFFTLNGDVGNYGMIQNLWKTEVYAMSEFLIEQLMEQNQPDRAKSLRDCIDAVPTDGLGITNSDLDQLGAPNYAEVDRILRIWTNEPEIKEDYICLMMNAGHNALEAQYMFDVLREGLKDHPVVKRHIASAFKRRDPFNIPRSVIEASAEL